MKRAIILIFSLIGFEFASGDQCPNKETQVPRKVNFDAGHSDYQLIESALQIYTHIRIPCDGWLDGWKFMVGPNQMVSGLHLGVFRPRGYGFFDLIGRSHFVVMPTPPNITWISHDVKQQIAVKRGDCLGIFYDKFETPSKQLTVRSKIVPVTHKTRHFPTYVMALDESNLSRNRTVDVRAATREFRCPALAAFISNEAPQNPNGNKRNTKHKQWAITAPTQFLQTVEIALAEKAKEAAEEEKVNKNLSTPPTTTFSSTSTQTVISSTSRSSLSFDSKCDEPIKIPTDFIKFPPDYYRFTETSLQIFTSMVVECDGYLSAWHFLATNEVVEGVHLGVFRTRSPSVAPTLLTLVDKTHVVNVRHHATAEQQRAIWVTYLPERPIAVKAGDLVGIFYDDYRIPSEMAAILSHADDDFSEAEGNKVPPTYVFLMDGQTLSTNDTVDVRDAAKAFRYPALSATVEPLSFVRSRRRI